MTRNEIWYGGAFGFVYSYSDKPNTWICSYSEVEILIPGDVNWPIEMELAENVIEHIPKIQTYGINKHDDEVTLLWLDFTNSSWEAVYSNDFVRQPQIVWYGDLRSDWSVVTPLKWREEW